MKIRLKRAALFAAAAIFSALAAAGCAGGAKQSINVFNWGDYIDPSALDQFEKETGIHVNYDTYASNEDMYAKIKAGGASYDVIVPSDYMVEKMIKEGMLETLDMGKIPNIKNIHPRFKDLTYDPAGRYSVPYMWGTLGILYNTKMVSDTVDSWNILWDEKYKGQIFMYNSERDAIAVGLLKLGYSINSTDTNELEAAKNALVQQKKLVKAYAGDNIKDSMIGGEGALALVYSGDAVYCINENPDLAYAVPNDGSNVWYDALAIPKGAPNKTGAEKFIDFMCRGDIAAKNSEYIGYSTVNQAAMALLPKSLMDDPTYWPGDAVFNNCKVYNDLGDAIKEYDRLWTEIMASN